MLCLAQAGILLLIFTAGAFAQSLSISKTTAQPGGAGSFLLTLDTPTTPAPVALQWKFIFPKEILVGIGDIVAGSAAESAQKVLTCSPLSEPKVTGFACVLAGGKQPLRRGPLATVRYHVSPNVTQAGKIRVEKIIAVTADMKQLEMPGAEGTVILQ